MVSYMLRIRSYAFVLASCLAAIVAMSMPIASANAANPADLDPSFGDNGLATNVLSSAIDTVSDVTVLPDGRVAWAGWGYYQPDDTYGFLLGSLTPGGAPEPGFGNGANVSRSYFGSDINYGNAIVAQPDGKLIVAGKIDSLDPAGLVARFSSTGQLDTAGFASPTGAAQEPDFEINAVGVQPGGKILTAGTGGGDFKIWRLTSAGAPDPTLQGAVATLSTDFFGEGDSAQDMVVLPDGGFVLAGTAHLMPGGNYLAMAKYLENGELDTSFGGDGKVAVWAPGTAYPSGQKIVVQPDGKLVVSMSDDLGAGGRISVLGRFLPNGDPDPSFGTAGFASTYFDGVAGASDLALQADGKIVVTASSSSSAAMVVGRFLPNGQIDPGFGPGGYTTLHLTLGNDKANAVAIQPDGKILIGGSVNPLNIPQADDWAVVRLRGGEPALPGIIRPVSTIETPSKRSLKAKSLRRIAGTAGPSGSIAKVEIAVRMIDARSLKKKRCVWLRNNKAKFKKIKSTSSKKCDTLVWLQAKGRQKWSYSFKTKRYLPKGSYEIYSRTTLTNGDRQASFATVNGNLKKLQLK
jgi:uncharacterized delta-60 repeat protein